MKHAIFSHSREWAPESTRPGQLGPFFANLIKYDDIRFPLFPYLKNKSDMIDKLISPVRISNEIKKCN